MFTGLVEAAVPVRRWETVGTGARLVLPQPGEGDLVLGAPEGSWGGVASSEPWSVAIGDSVAVAGCCLTVAAFEEPPGGARGPSSGAPERPDMAFDMSLETLERTWFRRLSEEGPGRVVNLERALRVGDRLGGHMVSGHVDGCGKLVGREETGDGGALFRFEVPAGMERYLFDKGSITIDGISLTVVAPEGRGFGVAVIPHTLERTHLRSLAPGDPVHLEADLVGKWVERLGAAAMAPRG